MIYLGIVLIFIILLTLYDSYYGLMVFLLLIVSSPSPFKSLLGSNPISLIGLVFVVVFSGKIAYKKHKFNYYSSTFVCLLLMLYLYILLSYFFWDFSARYFADLTYIIQPVVLFFLIINVTNTRKKLLTSLFILLISLSINAFVSFVMSLNSTDFLYIDQFFGNPNGFASMMLVFFFVSLKLYFIQEKLYLTVIYFIIATSLFLGIISCASIAMTVALITGHLAMSVFEILKRKDKKSKSRILVFVFLVLALYPVLSNKNFTQVFISDLRYKMTIGDPNRDALNYNAKLLFFESPFFGIGLGNFSTAVTQRSNTAKAIKSGGVVHNIYLSTLSELGILGFIMICALYASVVFKRRYLLGIPTDLLKIKEALIFSVVIYLVVSVAGGWAFDIHIWIILGYIGSINTIKS